MESIALIKEMFSGTHEVTKLEIIELINSLKKELDLYDYLRKIEIVDYSKKFEGKYLPSDKSMMISPHRIYENFLRWVNENNYPLNARGISRLYNLFVLITIYHEIFHVLQDKEDNESRKFDSRGILLHESIEFGRRIPQNTSPYEKLIYKMFYKLMLMERNAESEALYRILLIDEQSEFLTDREKKYIINEILNTLSYGYFNKENGLICPSQIYYSIRLKPKQYKDISFHENYDNFTKLSWGMPIAKATLEELFSISQTNEDVKKLLKSN